jgi:putative FmdB family regulatory protein
VQKISEKPIKRCPKCKENKLKRVITGTSFQLKGDNWFKTGGY